MTKSRQKKLAGKKKDMVEALLKSLGIVAAACEACNISRQTHYRWMADDAVYKSACDDIPDVCLDFAEASLFKLIKRGNAVATIFYLKTKGRNRGYVERQEIAVERLTHDDVEKQIKELIGDEEDGQT